MHVFYVIYNVYVALCEYCVMYCMILSYVRCVYLYTYTSAVLLYMDIEEHHVQLSEVLFSIILPAPLRLESFALYLPLPYRASHPLRPPFIHLSSPIENTKAGTNIFFN